MIWAVALAVFFAPLLLPEWVTWVSYSPLYIVYFFSVVAVLGVMLLAIAVGVVAVLLARAQRIPWRGRLRILVVFPSISLLLFAIVFGTLQVIAGDLPVGSRVMAFDAAAWKNKSSATYAERDITPRQKMLGDIVENVLPGRTRLEIESRLGPSEETTYFQSTGRDMIYMTGPERGLLSIDSEWLLIWLDEGGQFERYDVVQD